MSTIGVARTVVELLPNHLFEILDGNYAANTQSVLVGTPTAIQPEQALWWPDRDVNDGGDPKSVPFGEPAAMSRTWLVTLSVDRSIAGPSPVELLPAASTDELVTVRIQSDGGPIDVDRYRQGLLGLGRSVWFLTAYADGPKDAFGIAWFGGAVARVTNEGNLEFSLLSPDVRRSVEGAPIGLDDLVKAAQDPVVRIPRDGG